MHVGDADTTLSGGRINANAMGAARSGMLAIAVRGIALVHEALHLSNDGQGGVHKGRQPPLGRDRAIPVPQHALGGGAEDGGMVRQRRAHLPKEIRALRQDMVAIAIGEAVLVRLRTVDDLLQA